MITKMRVAGFKAWKDTGEFRLAPITVFFGKNSSGKTSLLQFLLMLKQTAQSPDERQTFQRAILGTDIDLGSWSDIVYRADLQTRIEFALSWTLPKHVLLKDPESRAEYGGDACRFSATVDPGNGARSSRVRQMCYVLSAGGEDTLTVRMTQAGSAGRGYKLSAEPGALKRRRGRPYTAIPGPLRFYGFPAEATAEYQNADLVSDLVLALEQQLRRVHCLGPLRAHPRREYRWSAEAPPDVGWKGESAVAALLAAAGRMLNRRRRPSRLFQEHIASWLSDVGLLHSFQTHRVAADQDLYLVKVKLTDDAPEVSLPDVGFGVSQVLPVAAQALYCEPHSTVIMEQPEIHLHPTVQAGLADLFIDAIHMREGGADRSVQFIIESHSPHFLYRLQRRVAEGKLLPGETAIYFCDMTRGGARLQPVPLDLFGNITKWPDGFFDGQLDDIVEMTKAGLRRKRETRG